MGSEMMYPILARIRGVKHRNQKRICKIRKLYVMKGTIYLWVLAAVLSGALVGLLGFVVEGVFSLQSSFMEPVIVAPLPGSWRY
jgi:hypothetical protein